MTDPTLGLGGGFRPADRGGDVGAGDQTGTGQGEDTVGATENGGGGSTPAVRGYEFHERIGEGGFGEVWRATRLDPGPRVVAIKILRTRLATRRDIERFRREARLLARLKHPGIADVLDSGTLDDGRPWFAIEFVAGRPLTEVAAGDCSIEDRLSILRDACDAIAHAHARGIIHCDLKPGNILVAGEPGRRVVKVIDFGVARLHEGEEPGRTMLMTETGGMLGTPAYMAPEQLISGEIDTRADVWSMGVILAELLSGRRPFEAGDPEGGILEEQRRIREEEPTSPSGGLTTLRRRDPDVAAEIAARRGRDLRELLGELRRELDWVVLRCIARRPDDRYASVAALGADLTRYLRHEPLEAGPPGAGYRTRKFVRRHRVGVTVAASVVILLVSGIAGTSWGLFKATRAAEAERLARETAERRLEQFGFINALNRRILTAVDPEVARGLDTTLFERTLESSLELVPEDGDPLVRSQLLLTLGESWSHLDRADEAVGLMRSSLAEADRSAKRDEPVPGLTDEMGRTDIRASLAKVLIDAAAGHDAETRAEMRSEAETLLRAAIETNTRLLGADHVRTLQDQANLAWLLMITRRLEEGLALLDAVHGRRLELLGPDHKATVGSASLLSDILIKLGRGTPSRYEQASQVVRDLLGESPDPNDPDLTAGELLLLNNLAIAQSRLGNQSERLRLLDGIATQVESLFGAENLVTLTVLYNHATTLIDRGRFAEATTTLERCLDGYRSRTGSGSVQIVRTLGRLGQAARLSGDLRDARRRFGEVLAEAGTVARDPAVPSGVRRERHLDAAGAALQLANLARLDGRRMDAAAKIEAARDHLTQADGDPILEPLVAAEAIELAITTSSIPTEAGSAGDPSLDAAVAVLRSGLESLPESRRRERATLRLAEARWNWAMDHDDDAARAAIAEIDAWLDADGTAAAGPIRDALAAWAAMLDRVDEMTERPTEG